MIILFSGTGNSAIVAGHLAEALPGEQVRRIDRSVLSEPITIPADESRVIWVFPIHSWGMPPILANALSRAVNLAPGIPHYMVATCGDDYGLAARQWRRAIAARSWTPAAAWSVQMPNTYVLLPGFDVDSPEVEAAKLEAEPARTAAIARLIAEGYTCSEPADDVTRGAMSGLKTAVVYPWFVRHMMSPRPFHALPDSCIACGRCVKACPLDNITLNCSTTNGRTTSDLPQWGDTCALCLACYHVCPNHAVAYGRATAAKGQYYGPHPR